MRIRFVGHAAVVVEAGDAVILTDPWLKGDAFNESWTPHPAPVLDDDTLDRLTHLWVSHEHPDHLSVPTLRSIPEERRAGITLLYQQHWSAEVVSFLRTLGFADVIELAHGQRLSIGKGVDVRLHQVGHEDSALTVHDGRTTVLDLNDCKPAAGTLRRICRQIGPVDVLLDQFSIAGWPGNPDDGPRIRAAASGALATLLDHQRVVRPRWVLPFASFVRFSHEENAWMNRGMNRVGDVATAIGRDRAVVMYPGDVWDIDAGGPSRPEKAIDRYDGDVEDVLAQRLPLRSHASEPFERVLAAAGERMAEVAAAFHRPLLARVGPVAFSLTDHERTAVVDLAAGTAVEAPPPPGSSIVRLSSQAAWYAFAHRWGISTLLISGRFGVDGPETSWRRLKQLGSAYSAGIQTRGAAGLLSDRRVLANVRRRWPDLYRDVVRRAA